LRRQLKWQFRKPMINMSPKANLRHIRSYSKIEEFTAGGFKEVLDDPRQPEPKDVKRVLLCSGKMYFDLSDKQISEDIKDTAVVRLEQLYPLPQNQLEILRKKYKKANWFWVQEEPANMGAQTYLKVNLNHFPIEYLSRPASASPATGFAKKHTQEQKQLVATAFSS